MLYPCHELTKEEIVALGIPLTRPAPPTRKQVCDICGARTLHRNFTLCKECWKTQTSADYEPRVKVNGYSIAQVEFQRALRT